MSYKETQAAKSTLEKLGYQVENLWCVEDARSVFPDITDQQALDLLHSALTNDATMEQIWFAIRLIGEDCGYKAESDGGTF